MELTEVRGPHAIKLRRRAARREPKRRFILFCEGKKTEPVYFSAVGRLYSDALVSIEINEAVGVPYTIAEKAVGQAKLLGLTKRSRRKKNSFEEADEVWAVFDRDNHPNFDNAVTLCENNGIRIARSNPCFELWLVLHEQEFDRPDSRHAVQEKLEGLRPEYDKDGAKIADCDDLVTRVKEAESRGEVLLRRREEERDAYGNPSTTVGRLTRAIREAHQASR